MSVCMCVCVQKDLANLKTYIVLYNVTCHRSWPSKLFWWRVPPPTQEKSPLEKNFPPQFTIFFKTKILRGGEGSTPPSPPTSNEPSGTY